MSLFASGPSLGQAALDPALLKRIADSVTNSVLAELSGHGPAGLPASRDACDAWPGEDSLDPRVVALVMTKVEESVLAQVSSTGVCPPAEPPNQPLPTHSVDTSGLDQSAGAGDWFALPELPALEESPGLDAAFQKALYASPQPYPQQTLPHASCSLLQAWESPFDHCVRPAMFGEKATFEQPNLDPNNAATDGGMSTNVPAGVRPVDPHGPRAFSLSGPTQVKKRLCKACDRCRLKKSKCDGASICSRCKADNAICLFKGCSRPDKVHREVIQPPEISIDFAPPSRNTKSDQDQSAPGVSNRGRAQFSLEAISVLDAWLKEHTHDPYPSKPVKEQLASEAGITLKQVSNWFANNRKRKLSEVEQWLSSSEDDEDVKQAAIREVSRAPCRRTSGFGSGDQSSRSPASVYGGQSSVSSVGSAFSQCSFTMPARSPRRGRRKHSRTSYYMSSDNNPSPLLPPIEQQDIGDFAAFEQFTLNDDFSVPFHASPLTSPHISPDLRPQQNIPRLPSPSSFSLEQQPAPLQQSFQCTFCHKKLSEKAWKRHEETQHLPKAKWICMAHGLAMIDADILPKCAFCSMPLLAPEEHFGGCHRTQECLEKSVEDRTFFRKDHLKQHVESFHGAQFNPDCADYWKQEIDYGAQKWHCGFCGRNLGTDWEFRAQHIAEHFRQGFDMKSWINTTASDSSITFCKDVPRPELLHQDSEPVAQKHYFQCTLCPKKFTRAYNLRSHLRTHTDERPFICSVCGKAFALAHHRKRHEGLHSGEKKFVCRGLLKDGNGWGCGRKFARADAFGRHFRSDAGQVCLRPVWGEELNVATAQAPIGLPATVLAQYPALAGIWVPSGDIPPSPDSSGYATDYELPKLPSPPQQSINAAELYNPAQTLPLTQAPRSAQELASNHSMMSTGTCESTSPSQPEATWIWSPEYERWYHVSFDSSGNPVCLDSHGPSEHTLLATQTNNTPTDQFQIQ